MGCGVVHLLLPLVPHKKKKGGQKSFSWPLHLPSSKFNSRPSLLIDGHGKGRGVIRCDGGVRWP
jgi:hypothetical protein